MQLYVINWSFQNAEDQLFATNEFREYFKEGKFNENIDGFELIQIVHTPQTGTGVIICKAQDAKTLFSLLDMWRKNYNILFDIKPGLTNEDLLLDT